MPSCVASGCTNCHTKKIPGITFHRFPKNEKQRKQWVEGVGRGNWHPSKYSVLCSYHFAETCVDRTSLSSIRLRENALPTIFTSSDLNSTQVEREKKSVQFLDDEMKICEVKLEDETPPVSYRTEMTNKAMTLDYHLELRSTNMIAAPEGEKAAKSAPEKNTKKVRLTPAERMRAYRRRKREKRMMEIRKSKQKECELTDNPINVIPDKEKIRMSPAERMRAYRRRKREERILKREQDRDSKSKNLKSDNITDTGITEELLRTKWRSLRDYFRAENRRSQSTKNGSYKSSWNHFDDMQFLNEAVQRPRSQLQFIPNDSSSQDGYKHGDQLPVETVVKIEYDENDQIISSNDHALQIESPISLASQADQRLALVRYETDINGSNNDANHTFQPPTSPVLPNSYQLGIPTKKRPASDLETPELQHRKLAALEKLIIENEDDDLQFFKSLIPDVKSLSRPRKALLRLKIQQLIVTEVYGDSGATEEETSPCQH